jgi:hypothetical protein
VVVAPVDLDRRELGLDALALGLEPRAVALVALEELDHVARAGRARVRPGHARVHDVAAGDVGLAHRPAAARGGVARPRALDTGFRGAGTSL